MKKVEVAIQPFGRRIVVDPELTVLHNLVRHNIYLSSDCAGKGTCGKCRIRYLKSPPEPSARARKLFSKKELEEGWRLACQSHLFAGAEILVPEQPAHHTDTILTHGERNKELHLNPAVRKVYLELPRQTIEDPISDTQLIIRELEDSRQLSFEVDALYGLSDIIREADHKITVLLRGDRIIRIDCGDTTKHCLGVALDIGTSTLVAALMDLKNGSVLGVSPAFNPQKIFGADVISRIQFCRENENGLEELNRILLERLEDIIGRLAGEHGLQISDIDELVAVGNPTMQHLFLGLNPKYLGEMPYIPVVSQTVSLFKRGPFAGKNWNFPIELPPNFSGFIGSDILAGIIAADMLNSNETQLFIDIGTNAEIVLGNKKGLCVSNCAAGPAFEGAKITCGMIGISGAIDTFGCDESDIIYNVIGGVKPTGICGSGLIDIVASFLDLGIIDETGRFLKQDEMLSTVPDQIKRRIRYSDGGPSFHITEDVFINQGDIRNVQAAKAAIAAGIKIITKRRGIEIGKIDRIIIAGAFGNYVDPVSAQRIGLIPRVPLKKIRSAGNTALEGAKMYLLSTEVRRFAERIPRIVEFYELATEPDFMNEYVEAMIFP